MIQIVTDNFGLIYKSLLKNKSDYNPRLLKRLKDDIYKLVIHSSPSKLLDVVGLSDIDDVQEIKTSVIGIGVGGYGKEPSAAEIYKAILIDNEQLDPSNVLSLYLPKLITGNAKMPIFKFIKQSNWNKPLNEKIKDIKAGFDTNAERSLYSKTDKKNITKYGINFKNDTISSLREKEIRKEIDFAYRYVYLLPIEKLEVNELKSLLIDTYNANKSIIGNSFFKKMIRLYDYLAYGVS